MKKAFDAPLLDVSSFTFEETLMNLSSDNDGAVGEINPDLGGNDLG